MKYALILALSSTALAAPFTDYLDAIFGTKETRDAPPPPGQLSGFPPMGTGYPTGIPLSTATGAFPAHTDSMPHMAPVHPHKRNLAINYQLAPRQGTGLPLPSFSLVQPTDGTASTLPTQSEEGGFPLPTGQPDASSGPVMPSPTGGLPTLPSDVPSPSDVPFPTDLPSPMPTGGAPFPGTGMPGLSTTLETLTRGPKPTGMPELPGQEDGEQVPGDDGPGGFSGWFSSFFGGGGKSEMSP